MAKCPLCRQQLPEGTTYCVGCGIETGGGSFERKAKLTLEAHDRQENAKDTRRVWQWLRVLRWFR